MRPEHPSISIIIPTLNEAENIEPIIRRILAGAASLSLEIIVVDDGSRDETQKIVKRLESSLPVVLLARDHAKDGLAGAVLAGARAARAAAVLVIDADGSHPPEKIPELALPVIEQRLDMVIGSRYAPGGSTPGWSRQRRLMSRAASACAWPLTDVHDALSGFFAVRRDLLVAIPSDAAGFKIALEILVRGGDSLRVGEVPIVFRDRELGQSKMGSKVIFTYFRRLLALSGWRESDDRIRLAVLKTGLVWTVDFALFTLALRLDSGLNAANLLGFAAGAVLNGWLKRAQLPPESRTRTALVPRLLFLSLVALFLRGGVLGTFTAAFRWPGPAAIFPALVTSWAVLSLGYALFIWPMREQYGAGVRWRVAAIGAAAYLLALRIVYLHAMPVNPRLAALPWNGEGLSAGDRLTASLRALGVRLLGGTWAGFNVAAPLCWCVGAWAIFHATHRLCNKTAAFQALLLYSVLPVFFVTGAMFSQDSVLIAVWALVLWLITFPLRWGRPGLIGCAAAAAVFWCPGGWLPAFHVDTPAPTLARPLLFFLAQLLLVTPASFPPVFRYFLTAPQGPPAPRKAIGWFAAAAGLSTLAGYTGSSMGLTASGALWLPLLPVIAAEMQRLGGSPLQPDRPQGAPLFWGAAIYTCVVVYGAYLYWLAFPAWHR